MCIQNQDKVIERFPVFKISEDGTYEQWMDSNALVCYEATDDQFSLKILFIHTVVIFKMNEVEGFFQS